VARAVVLGGGGIVGVAWGCGYLAGLEEGGVSLADADEVVGTSAGSIVAAWLTSGKPIARRLRFVERPDGPLQRTLGRLAHAFTSRESTVREQAMKLLFEEEDRTAAQLQELGRLAREAPAMPEPLFVGIVAALVGRHSFGRDSALRATAMDTETGERLVLGPGQRVGVARACAASSAVPGIFPPVKVHGRKLMDGGCVSGTNADLVAGAERAVVISLLVREATPPSWMVSEIAELERNGTHVQAVLPNTAALEAAGDDLLDPAVAPDVARAGRAQGRREAASVGETWGS
jgi:NTE family protein